MQQADNSFSPGGAGESTSKVPEHYTRRRLFGLAGVAMLAFPALAGAAGPVGTDGAVKAAWVEYRHAHGRYQAETDEDDDDCPHLARWMAAQDQLLALRPEGLGGIALQLRASFLMLGRYQRPAAALVFDRASDIDRHWLAMQDLGLTSLWAQIEAMEARA